MRWSRPNPATPQRRLKSAKLWKSNPPPPPLFRSTGFLFRARVAIDQGNPGKAIQLLSPALATETAITDEFSASSLYPAYVRGQAYLLIGDGRAAAAEFQKLTGHPGLVLNTPLAALARLQLARAYAISGESSKALAGYRDFLALWKDADRDTPVLVKASAELAQAQRTISR